MNQHIPEDHITFDDEANARAALHEKLIDALTPGCQIEFDPDEAFKAGAFFEDALSEQDALESDVDAMNGEAQ